MRKTTVGVAILAALAVLAAAGPLGASSKEQGRLVNAIRVQLTGPTSGVGEFSACCAVNDSGTVEVAFRDAAPGRFDANRTFVGVNGCTYSDRIRGKFEPTDGPRAIVQGHWKILTGAGTCADLRGGGKFIGVLDLTNFTVKGTNFGGASSSP